jgi:CO dehydrogenase nickel-insertion accessory protein CooC1
MNTSNVLIEQAKKILKIGTDMEVSELIPHMNKGNLSKIRKGERHLTEEQALWIAEQCQLDAKLVLVELAEECAKCEAAKTVWHSLAKKMKAATSVMALAGLLLVSGVSGHFSPQKRVIP